MSTFKTLATTAFAALSLMTGPIAGLGGLAGIATLSGAGAAFADQACGNGIFTCTKGPNLWFTITNKTPAPIWITTYDENGNKLDHWCSMVGHTDNTSKPGYSDASGRPVNIYVRVEGKNISESECGNPLSAFNTVLPNAVWLNPNGQALTLTSTNWTTVPTLN